MGLRGIDGVVIRIATNRQGLQQYAMREGLCFGACDKRVLPAVFLTIKS